MKTEWRFSSRVTGFVTAGLVILITCPAFLAELPQETKEQQNQRMQWWQEARFGMFIHWGLYSIPSGTWQGKKFQGGGEDILTTAKIPLQEYTALAKQFNPKKFNAKEWVSIAKNTGMKYIVMTAKYRDGFCLFDSSFTNFDIKATPFKRDIMKELANECRKQGIKICWYYSVMDWYHPDYLPRGEEKIRPWDARPKDKADFNRYMEYLKSQVNELLTKYGDIGVFWFDGSWEHSEKELRSDEIISTLRRLNPKIIINDRLGIPQDFSIYDQESPPAGNPGRHWEWCMTMNETWGYKSTDMKWKSSKTLIRTLVNAASKGGNYLLNISPTAEGAIPEASVVRLDTTGRWMAKNSESIYGTAASPFKKLPWGCCTAKPGKLYLHVFDWPQRELNVPGLNNTIKNTYILADPKKIPLKTSRIEDTIYIKVPSRAPDTSDTVIVMEIEGEPKVATVPVKANQSGILELNANDADLHGNTIKMEYKSDDFIPTIGQWSNENDTVAWPIETGKAGDFTITMTYSCPEASAGSEIRIIAGDQELLYSIESTPSWDAYTVFEAGKIRFPKAGKYEIWIKPVKIAKDSVMNLRKVEIKSIER